MVLYKYNLFNIKKKKRKDEYERKNVAPIVAIQRAKNADTTYTNRKQKQDNREDVAFVNRIQEQ